MRKIDELSQSDSCLSKAMPDELLFILLGRDRAAPATIRFWVRERLALGKNEMGDRQVIEALALADTIEAEHAKRASVAV